MNILLLGSGGREDALAWRLRQSPSCDELVAAPGNPGIARWAKCVAIDPCDLQAVVALATATATELVVIGPEAPLVAGVADALACSPAFFSFFAQATSASARNKIVPGARAVGVRSLHEFRIGPRN